MQHQHEQSLNPQQAKVKLPGYEPYRCRTTQKILCYEWSLLIVVAILMLSALDAEMNNLRIVVYCIGFLLVETLKNTDRIIQIEDPLSLSSTRKVIKELVIVLQINIIYLLFRVLIQHHNVYSFVFFLHCSFVGMIGVGGSGFEKASSKKAHINHSLSYIDPLGANQGSSVSSIIDASSTLWKVLTPLLLFIFSVVIDRPVSEISLLQLILLTLNLILSTEIRFLLINRECTLFGWERQSFEGKNHLVFIKSQAVRKILFVLCAAIVIQNLMCALPGMNEYASFTMLHSLVLGAFLLYVSKSQGK